MTKKIEKLFKSYRDQLLHLAKLYGIVEIKSYARSAKRLTISQLELLLIKNRIKLPISRSSDKAIAKQELKENSIRNIYLSIGFVFFIGFLITVRPYIKNIVNEVLDSKIRPAVARDGGDITFKSFKDGIVTVELKGSCSGCPSSIMTLKQGVQNLLCHYISEVKSVEAI